MKVSLDSNAWERIFEAETITSPIEVALCDGVIKGFICAASFRIEAIRRRERHEYFAQPHIEVRSTIPDFGRISFSIGPNDNQHPGLPNKQAPKLRRASAANMKLMRGQNWMGLPSPAAIDNPTLYAVEGPAERSAREQRQLDISTLIDDRGLGHTAFLDAGGWEDRQRTPADQKRLSRACAEWADGELVAAHIAYGNDILCTDDRAIGAGHSIFDTEHRTWLNKAFGVKFMTLSELTSSLAA